MKTMKDRRMDRFVVLPFSTGCASQSSVAVADSRPKKPQQDAIPPPRGKRCNSNLKPKGESFIARLVRSFKSLSQIFAVYDEDEEEEERELEIGYPTDVKHVAHIGWDGSTNTTRSMKSWNRSAPESTSLPSFSMRQFELAMAAQAGGAPTLL